MTSPSQAEQVGLEPALEPADTAIPEGGKKQELAGRSPGQLIWLRYKRDRVGVLCTYVVLAFYLVALCAPLISMLYGKNPYDQYGLDNGLFDEFGLPGAYGGMSSEHWFGIEPNLGRDVFMQLVYGIRTSLLMAIVVTILSIGLGVLIGLVGGFMGGWVDYAISRVTDFALAIPSQLFMIAATPVIVAVFVGPLDETPTYVRALSIIIVLWFLGWMGMARLVRSTTLTLREREFVEAAKVSGASRWRIIRKELLPNLVSPIIVQATYTLPSTILSVAFLSFVGVGFVEPTPDWGRMFATGAKYMESAPMYMLFPGAAMFIFVAAFNLLGDSVRDAFDPKSGR
ncbi:ABC transporter permease [Streptomyces polyrhachis]|uniref:ABC transporter permease n=1 Tax=Streptomyces polyrhachis TaxID=1282885 RepID=A0ABW2GKI7_9ACTN